MLLPPDRGRKRRSNQGDRRRAHPALRGRSRPLKRSHVELIDLLAHDQHRRRCGETLCCTASTAQPDFVSQRRSSLARDDPVWLDVSVDAGGATASCCERPNVVLKRAVGRRNYAIASGRGGQVRWRKRPWLCALGPASLTWASGCRPARRHHLREGHRDNRRRRPAPSLACRSRCPAP